MVVNINRVFWEKKHNASIFKKLVFLQPVMKLKKVNLYIAELHYTGCLSFPGHASYFVFNILKNMDMGWKVIFRPFV